MLTFSGAEANEHSHTLVSHQEGYIQAVSSSHWEISVLQWARNLKFYLAQLEGGKIPEKE